jgi:hypothetical protein
MRTKLLVLAMVLGACSRTAAAPEAGVGNDMIADPAPASYAAPVEQRAALTVQSAGLSPATVPADAAAQRMIVRSATLALQVANVRDVIRQVTSLTAEEKGFLGASRLWREGEAERASMTVRVPADALDATLARLRALAVRVENEAVTGDDVTRQAVDLNAQLTNLRATETELRALLTTVRQRTQKAADVLAVHTELSRIRGEIEQRTAELQTLSQLAAMSTITLELLPDVGATPIATDAWQPVGVLRDALRALVSLMQTGANVMIWTVVCGLPLGALGWAGFGLVRAARRRTRPMAQA